MSEGALSEGSPRVEEIFNRAVAAQLAEQQAQRDAFEEVERRLEAIERHFLEIVTQSNGHLPEGVALDDVTRRLEVIEMMAEERISLLESVVREDAVGERLVSIERAVAEGMSVLRSELVDSTDRRLQAIEDAIALRLGQMEASVRHFQEETSARLDDMRDAQASAEAGILERIIVESQVVGAVFESVRPAVEAAAQVGPELENTLEELRQIAENVQSGGDTSESPYSAEELNAPHQDEEEHESLFLPPEETPIPERRFGGRPKRER